MSPSLIYGGIYIDSRGELKFNNSFNMSQVKRFYSITLKEKLSTRRWQGHQVEQRWFTAVSGSFRIQLILVDNWNKPKAELNKINFDLSSDKLDVPHIPGGYLTSIESTSDNSTLLVMSDYRLNDIDDEYRFPEEYFKN